MILYRCGTSVPEGCINPSNWATDSIALGCAMDLGDGALEIGGDTIIIIEIPTPSQESVGPYARVQARQTLDSFSRPFGRDEANGWWSFNQPYAGPVKVVDVLRAKDFCLNDIDYFDLTYKSDQKDWAPWLRANADTAVANARRVKSPRNS